MTEKEKTEFILKELGISEEKAAMACGDTPIEEICEWDSLTILSFIMVLKDNFDKQAEIDELKKIKTVGELIRIVG